MLRLLIFFKFVKKRVYKGRPDEAQFPASHLRKDSSGNIVKLQPRHFLENATNSQSPVILGLALSKFTRTQTSLLST